MSKIVTVPLPHDLPEDWRDTQYVSPGGTEVGLTERHGYNYLMKQVNNAQRAAAELDAELAAQGSSAFHKNLLHNWFFPNPIDQKQGYVALPNTPYYSDTALTVHAGTTSGHVRAAKVNNVYCTIVIGNTYYYVRTSSAFMGYVGGNISIDRWVLRDGTSQSYLKQQSDGIILNLGKASGSFRQTLTITTMTDYFMGLTYTASVRVESVSGGTPSLYIANGEDNVVKSLITETGITTITTTLSGDIGDDLEVGIINDSTSEDCALRVYSMKLEVGSVATLTADPPADYAEQMAICVQYDPETSMYKGFPPFATANILADAVVTE